jgi:hypothetical protein
MVNQDPQPEIYSSTHSFTGATLAANSVIGNTINTFQAANEEVRIYALAVEMQDTSDVDVAATYNNFDVAIQAGVNRVPSNYFDIGAAALSRTALIELTCPVVIKFKQPLQVNVRWSPEDGTTACGAPTNVKIKLIGEIGVQKIVG